MKITGETMLIKNQPGSINIIPEQDDDLWLLSNLILPNDVVSAETSRKIPDIKPVRVRLNIEVKVKKVDYNKKSCSLRVSGKILTQNSYINGLYHTLELEYNKAFDLKKNSWDSIMIENLKEGCKNKVGCDLGVVLIDSQIAQLYLVGKSSSNLCATIEAKIGKKKNDPLKFYERILSVLIKNLDFSVLHCLMIAGLGSIKVGFKQFLVSQASRMKGLEGVKSRVVMVEANSMGKEGLREVLGDSKVMNLIKDTKSAIELKAMKELNDMLNYPDKACYGPKTVELANEMMGIDTLLITDELCKNGDSLVRKKYYELMNSVKKSGGNALMISSMHVSGEQLTQLTGIAAILRFPIPDIDDLEL